MPVTLEQMGTHFEVNLEGAVDITSAAELKEKLLQAFKSGREVRVMIARATDLDVTAVEMLWAAEREAKSLGVRFGLTGLVHERVAAALAEAGFEEFPVPVEVG